MSMADGSDPFLGVASHPPGANLHTPLEAPTEATETFRLDLHKAGS